MRGDRHVRWVALAWALGGIWLAALPAAALPPCENPSLDGSADPQALLTRYWTSRQIQREHFLRNELDAEGGLLGDGIGDWLPAQRRYAKAGFGIPANYRIMAHDTRPECDADVDTQNDPGLKNVLAFGDATIQLGRHIALLATEYHLLGKSGQLEAQKRTLNELFLALQAYRRLDMTANRLWKLKMDHCGPSGCAWQPDLTGHSGWFIRDDVPFDFYRNFPADVADDWKVGGVKSDYACRTAKLLCGGFPRPMSQDQAIGLLFGLAFVKRFVPAEAEVTVNGTRYNPLAMAQKIAYGIVKRIVEADGHKIRFPRCSSEPVKPGAETDGYLYGIIKTANFILPAGQRFETKLGMEIAWEASRKAVFAWNSIDDGLGLDSDWDKPFNVRMLLELIAAGNVNYNDAARKKADPDFLVLHFAWAALHDKTVGRAELDKMACMLCAYRCPGPCQQTPYYRLAGVGPAFDCPNLPGGPGTTGGGACAPRPWCREFWQGSFDCSKAPYHGQRFNPGSYLLAYALFHLAGGTAAGPFFDPGRIESVPALSEAELRIVGPESIQPEQTAVYEILAPAGGPVYEWQTSPNLEILELLDGDPRRVRLRAIPNSSGTAWIEAAHPDAEYDGLCERSPRSRKSLWIGAPPTPPPALNGAFPARVATAPDDYCDRCAMNPPEQVAKDLVTSPDYVMGYLSGKALAGVSAPFYGNGSALEHRQGIQRVFRNGKNYLIVSNRTFPVIGAGFETVALGSNPEEPFELHRTLPQPGACAPATDRIVRYTAQAFLTHADSIQVLGNRFLAIGYSRPRYPYESEKPRWCLYDLRDPERPVLLGCTPVAMSWAGAAALTRLDTGRYMAWIFDQDAKRVEIFTAESPFASPWLSHGVYDPFGSGWNAYDGLQFVTGCNGELFLAASHNNGGGEGDAEDWLDLWRVTFTDDTIARPKVEKVAKRHMYCSSSATANVRYCNFAAGAGTYITPEGHLLFYGIEHRNDLCNGYGVKWREFPNAANSH